MIRKSNIPDGTILTNKWPGKCCRCGCDVRPFAGKSHKQGKWFMYCLPCWKTHHQPAPAPAPTPKPTPAPAPQLEKDTEGDIEFAWESWGDYVNAAANGNSHLARHDRESRSIKTDNWNGTNTWEDALNLAKRGWPDGWYTVKEIASKIGEAAASRTLTIETAMAETGDELDVPLLLTGEPECWYNYPLVEHKATGGRIVKMAVNTFISSGVSHEAIINRGAAALAVLDALESNGYRVELTIMGCATGRGNGHLTTTVKAKESDQPIDMDRLAFAVVHPASVRRVMFAVWETLGQTVGDKFGVPGYYGYPATSPKAAEYDIYFDKLHYNDDNWRTLEGATSKALEALTNTGLLKMRQEPA